jgi:transcriptional regulator with XRE-family HTH domain
MVKNKRTRPAVAFSDRNKMAGEARKRELAENIYRLLLSKGWRQADLSRATGLPRDMISTYVLGKALAPGENVRKMAEAFGVDATAVHEDFLDNRAKSNPLVMRASTTEPGKTWIKVARYVSNATARKIFELVQMEDEAANRK